MRITYLGALPPIRGGIAQHGARVVAALRSAGHDTTAVSWAAQYPHLLYKRDQVDPGAAEQADRRTLRWWSPVGWWRERRAAADADLIVVPWVTPVHAPPIRALLTPSAGERVVIVHNALPHESLPFDRRLARWALGAADRFVVHAADVADDLAMLGLHQPVSVVTHPPNLDMAPTPVPPVDGPVRLLSFGFVRPYKGVDIALDAVAVLRARGVNVHLTVAGEIWAGGDDLRARAARPDLAGSIDLIDRYIGDDETAELFAGCHLVVAPYRSATQSGIIPLAHAAGRAAVVTAVGGLPEAIRDGVDGVLCEPEDPEALAGAVERALGQLDALAAGASAAAPRWAEVAAAITGDPA